MAYAGQGVEREQTGARVIESRGAGQARISGAGIDVFEVIRQYHAAGK